MRGLPFIGMVCWVPCLALLGPAWHDSLAVPEPGRPLPDKALSSTTYQFPRPQQEVTGLRYQVRLAGQEVFTFSGKRLSLRKKKLGLLSFGLLNELSIDDGTFLVRQPAVVDHQPSAQGQQAEVLSGLANLDGLRALFPGARVMGLTCQPLSLILDQGEADGQVAITAKRATIGADQQRLQLEGGVTLRSRDAVLTCGQMEIDPKGTSIVARNYQLISTKGSRHGQELRGDIFLRSLDKDI